MNPIKSSLISGTYVSAPINNFSDYIGVSGKQNYNYTYTNSLFDNDRHWTKEGRYVSGLNTIGDISINWIDKIVTHRLWWRNYAINEDDNPLQGFPLTKHEIDIS